MKPMLLIAVLILSTTKVSHAQTDLADNAALRYYQAIVSLVSPFYEEHRDTVRAIRLDKDWIEPTPEVLAALEAHTLTLKYMSQGAAIEPCDFGIDFSGAYDTLFVGIQELNACDRLLLADACRALEDGDTHTADLRIAQTIKLARHLWRFAGSIGPLVSGALVERITQITTEALDRGLIQPEQFTKTADALAFLDQHDPFDARSVIELERTNTHALVNAALNDLDGDTAAKLDKVIHQAMGVIAAARDSDKTPDIKLFDWLLSEDPEEARAELRGMLSRYDRFTDETLATLDSETPCETAEELRDRIKDYGLLSQVFADSLPRLVYYSHHTAEQLRNLADRLGVQQSAASTHRPQQINAALLYWPAFGFILKEDRARLDLIRTPEEVVQMSDALRAFLCDHEQTIELLSQATAMDHCDFGNRETTFDTLQSHVGFSRSSVRLLVCDAVRLFRDAETELGEQRLLTALDVASDCAQTHNSIETLIHAAGVAFVVDVAGRCLDEGMVAPGNLNRLRDRLEAYDDDDPFQFRECISAEKALAHRSVEHAVAESDSGPEFASAFHVMIASDADGVDPMARALFSHENWKIVVNDALRSMDRYYDDIEAALETEDPVASMRELDEHFLRYGIFAGIFAPAFDRMYQQCEKVNAELHALLDRLESPQTTD